MDYYNISLATQIPSEEEIFCDRGLINIGFKELLFPATIFREVSTYLDFDLSNEEKQSVNLNLTYGEKKK